MIKLGPKRSALRFGAVGGSKRAKGGMGNQVEHFWEARSSMATEEMNSWRGRKESKTTHTFPTDL